MDELKALLKSDDPLLRPLLIGGHTFPGIWGKMMPRELIGLHFPEERREVGQRPVHQRLDPPQRMVLRHPALGRDQAQHVRLGIDFSAHALSDGQPHHPV